MPGQNYEARGERILEATAELVSRWGYKKTTIDDIARQAGVAKGTIYLHWKTREELFQAMLVREELKLVEEMKALMEADPVEGATLHGMLKYAMLATMRHPIWKAMVLQDADLLGELAQTPYMVTIAQKSLDNFRAYFNMLREQKLIRTDLTMKQFIFLVKAISTGFLINNSLMPQEFQVSDEEAADMLAETIRRTCALDTPATREDQRQTASTLSRYIDTMVDTLKEREQKEP